ncbi:MAG: hypothetical protein JWM05_1725 [Acidimicrobiales bacterium]|nr:hypothetical protein [Acidimicrobiales bacterium]
MRPFGGPTQDRNALGRWQDRREDRLTAPYGQARQASWTYIVLLLVGCAVVAAVTTWAYLQLLGPTAAGA